MEWLPSFGGGGQRGPQLWLDTLELKGGTPLPAAALQKRQGQTGQLQNSQLFLELSKNKKKLDDPPMTISEIVGETDLLRRVLIEGSSLIQEPQKSTFSSIFLGHDQTTSKNVEILIDIFTKRRLTKVKNSTMSNVEHSIPCIDI